MKKLLLLITLMFAFMAFSPVEKGDLLKVSPVVEDVQMDVNTNFDLQNESQWIMTTYNIPLEPGYTVSAPLAGNYVTTFPEGAILCNYSIDMPDSSNHRYWQNNRNSSLQYDNTGYPIHESDNFVRWL